MDLNEMVKKTLEQTGGVQGLPPDNQGEQSTTEAGQQPDKIADKQEEFADVPFHKHPRFKELVEEKNRYKSEIEEMKKRLEEEEKKYRSSLEEKANIERMVAELRELKELQDKIQSDPKIRKNFEILQKAMSVEEELPEDIDKKDMEILEVKDKLKKIEGWIGNFTEEEQIRMAERTIEKELNKATEKYKKDADKEEVEDFKERILARLEVDVDRGIESSVDDIAKEISQQDDQLFKKKLSMYLSKKEESNKHITTKPGVPVPNPQEKEQNIFDEKGKVKSNALYNIAKSLWDKVSGA